ncbi:glucose-6-phosphate dehydrogenase [Polyangium sp. 15x6]|uniref:glucose-6-phosphate dehydrogenase n=1 Tax=Polyangium sp. 15x6 TaxID=3042687 RepID=UPI00249BADC5|nr:glucose-6-phosphate dehydrogenase [Polyangium sp. 15x6]MDI3290616.1 glucose-6-phosphate dehydrogenase [Polyangium sp. 15x6]
MSFSENVGSGEENPLREGMPDERTVRPATVVIFGASGDLTRRKLLPAIYNLALSRLLPGGFAVVGVARRPKPEFGREMREAVAKYSRRKPLDEATWSELEKGMAYVQGDFNDPATYARLAAELGRLEVERGTGQNRVFYMAVGPTEVPMIVRGLCDAKLVVRPADGPDASYQRVVVEKPFGEDLASARALNKELLACVDERQIYRIDHYLGKETVQNLLVFRFGNTIFEPLWSRQHVSHVQITVAEELGVEGRGKFYDQTGITRDIVQNHALQLLTMVTMEPPSSWDADAVRDEKVKVLRALRPIRGREVLEKTVRAQYTAGTVRGDRVPGYREEPDVDPNSKTETYVAMSLRIDSFRWGGVPFYLRSGKRLAKRVAEVALHFKPLPHRLFRDAPQAMDGGPPPSVRRGEDEPNVLVLRIQPDEGIALRFATKVPGGGMTMRNVAMDFRYGTAFGSSTPEAYERLILDAMRGDATLFTRADEVEAQWGFIDPILAGWRDQDAPVATYEAGSWGPREADRLLVPGDKWRKP